MSKEQERSPSEMAELNRTAEILNVADILARELRELLARAIVAKTCDELFLYKGRLHSWSDCIRELIFRL